MVGASDAGERERAGVSGAGDGAADARRRRSGGAGDGAAKERARVTIPAERRRRETERAAEPARAGSGEGGSGGASAGGGAARPDGGAVAERAAGEPAGGGRTADALVRPVEPAAVVPAAGTADIAVDAIRLRFDRAVRMGDCEGAGRLLAAAGRHDAGRDLGAWVERLTEARVLGRCQQSKEQSE